MRDIGGSMSSASTSATIVKRSPPNDTSTSSGVSCDVSPNSMTSPSSGSDQNQNNNSLNKCKCCPYGYHIDLGFVSYAQNVSNGFVSRQGTPTNMTLRGNGADRHLMSPLLDNSIFSDSLDNLMSDFDDVLAPHKEVEKKKTVQDIRSRMQGGYNSDYTTYRRGPPEIPRRAHFEQAKPPPLSRPINLGFSGSRSNTPTQRFNAPNGTGNGYSTALAKTISEIRARNAESPFPDSRVGTPIDLGLHQQNNGHVTPSRFANNRYDDLPPTPTPTFRRAPSQGDLPRGFSTAPSTGPGDFASLRRGREFALPPEQEHHSRRFFSASPKLPRRGLQAGPSIDVESHFTYAQTQNGQKVLARTQSTSTSPPPQAPASAFEPVKPLSNGSPSPTHQVQKPIVTRSIAVSTGPLPAPKPCGECAGLRKELFLAVEKIPPPPPESCHVSTSTVLLEFADQSVGSEPIKHCHVALGTEPTSTREVGTVPVTVRSLHIDTQTDPAASTVDAACSPVLFETQEEAVKVTVAASSSAAAADCEECLKRQDVFTRNVGVGACSISDKICVSCDNQVVEADENEAPGFKTDTKDDQKQRDFEIAKANAVKKLLTNEQKSNFQRGTAVSKSARYDRKRSVDDLDYIVDKKNATSPATSSQEAPPTVPDASESPLTTKVVLKKEVFIEPPKQMLPDPIPARIPRPKISKWAVTSEEEAAETPDEQEEAQDRLTPLRSDMRQLGNRWNRNQVTTASNTTPHLPYSGATSQKMAENSYKPPEKMIKNVFDLNPWYFSKAYEEYLAFLHRLNDSVVGVHTTADMRCTDLVISFIDMLDKLEKWAEEIPLEDVSEQRFGNKAYRKFYEKLCKESPDLLASVLPENVHDALVELVPYFTESFGNATRIDYGSGHEANFLILLFCLQKLGVFTENDDKVLVLRIFNKYLRVCRHLQTRFKMEPAGSRGVHAIDDFQFAPFIFGSAQLIGSKSIVPDSYLKKNIVETHAHTSLFLDCVNFINQTKTGPFHEHSNQLWNISAVPHWKKVNSGMFKMYEGEVLKKFPVVQHMMFGSLFSFDRSEHPRESMEDAPSQDPMPPRAPAQHGMFAFKIPSAANTSTVHSSSVVESGDLRRLHSEKHPNEHCPPPMADA